MHLVIAPNASMSQGNAAAALLTAAIAATAAGGALLLHGLWPVALCQLLAVVALAGALRAGLVRNRYREFIHSIGRDLLVEYGRTGIGPIRAVCLPRAWTRVTLCKGPHRNSPTRLVLSACGCLAEVGCCLTEAERESLARRLRQLCGSAWTRQAGDETH